MNKEMDFFVKELGLTHQQIAILLQTSRSTITRYLLGLRPLGDMVESRLMLLYYLHHVPASVSATPAMAAEEHPGEAATLLEALRQAREEQRQLDRVQDQLAAERQRGAALERWVALAMARPELFARPAEQRCLQQLAYRQQCSAKACAEKSDELARRQQQLRVAIARLEKQLGREGEAEGWV